MGNGFSWIHEIVAGVIGAAILLAVQYFIYLTHNRYLRNMQADRMDQLISFALDSIRQSRLGCDALYAGKSIDGGDNWYNKPKYVSARLGERYGELNQWKTDAHIVFPKEHTKLVFRIFWKAREIFRIALKSRQFYMEVYERRGDVGSLDQTHRVDDNAILTIGNLLKEYISLRNTSPYKLYRRHGGEERLLDSFHKLQATKSV